MSVENKIREMMSRKLDEAAYPGANQGPKDATSPMQGSSKKAEVEVLDKGTGAPATKETNVLKAGAGAKEDKPAKQGSSQDAAISTHDDQTSQGKTQSAKAKKQPVPMGHGAGSAPNFTTVADPHSVVNQPSSKGNVYKEDTDLEEVSDEHEFISEEEYNSLSDEEKAEYEAIELEESDEVEDDEEIEEAAKWRNNPKAHYTTKSGKKVALGDYKHNSSSLQKRKPATFDKAGKVTKKHAENLKDRIKDGFSYDRAGIKIGEEVAEAMMMKKMKEELHQDVINLFASETDLSEEFMSNAASLFEAVVTARVTHEVEQMEDVLAEAAVEAIAEMEQQLTEQVDAYLSYIAEQWLEANQVAVAEGLRAEVTEDFIAGLKVLFKENYIEIPEEKYDVLGEMQAQIEELTAKLNETIADAVELNSALAESKRDAIFTKMTSDLAQTEAEKLRGLVEEVEFENEGIFEQKLSVIKNNYFPKSSNSVTSSLEEGVLVEETSSTVQKYAELLSRSKFGK